MWTRILNVRLIEPNELTQQLNGVTYLQFLHNNLVRRCSTQYLQRNVVSTRWLATPLCSAWIWLFKRIIYQQFDRTPGFNFMAPSFPRSESSRFLLGMHKRKVYSKPIQNPPKLRQEIDVASEEINPSGWWEMHDC